MPTDPGGSVEGLCPSFLTKTGRSSIQCHVSMIAREGRDLGNCAFAFKVSTHKGHVSFLVLLHLSKQVTWSQLISKKCSMHFYHVLSRRRARTVWKSGLRVARSGRTGGNGQEGGRMLTLGRVGREIVEAGFLPNGKVFSPPGGRDSREEQSDARRWSSVVRRLFVVFFLSMYV